MLNFKNTFVEKFLVAKEIVFKNALSANIIISSVESDFISVINAVNIWSTSVDCIVFGVSSSQINPNVSMLACLKIIFSL